ncbi:hypothetical protein [Cyanobium sp. Morenito 9A2]|uniref:hypothetical protein n=1 Tax=Cyanobium sp. Morenito 9A2 TaxID=2823718 RepID=UPI0020CC4CA9|nr:hypothetical protein [Cyanobium sp. Morenito 9A2]MCP9848396.1 hypothetical protein [Cyanobium sp. Morenito 9A2]
MTPPWLRRFHGTPSLQRGLLVGGVQVILMLSLGAQLLFDRATSVRCWTRALPVDPNLPIRARYVSLRLEGSPDCAVSSSTVAFFIPDPIDDPSRRAPGEELWVEVTLPRKGPPRPIRLGVKRNGMVVPSPLQLD